MQAVAAAVAVFTLSASPAFAVIPPELQDDTKRNAGIQLSYEVRALVDRPLGNRPERFAEPVLAA